MTVKELMKKLAAHEPDREVIVLWHGYQRNVVWVSETEDGFVRLEDEPRTSTPHE